MICRGCYKEVKEDYCLSCRKKLFEKAKIPAVLSFYSPNPDNLFTYQEYSKHLSISGVQLKYSLHLENGKLELSEKGGQYILKPVPPSKQLAEPDHIPENEHLTMQIAEQLFGINTAANGLIYFRDGLPAYITRRFDIKNGDNKYMQEDFAQLMNRSKNTNGEDFKYDSSYEEIGLLIKRFVAASMPALERFFQLVVFNYVISNGDAHLKNFSLMRSDSGEYLLTPAYDLMSTIIHTPFEADTALDLYKGGMDSEFYSSFGYYGRPDFMELANRLGIVEKRSARIIDQFSAMEKNIIALVERSFLPREIKAKYIINTADKIKRLLFPGS